ncbi:MAG: glucokinase [Thermodesulfobacteriota bacterium]
MSKNSEEKMLAGDIGGTKTAVGIFTRTGDRPEASVIETFDSRKADGLESIIDRFLQNHSDEVGKENLHAACFGVAGPVDQGRCKATNLPWVISEGSIQDRFGWEKVRLINDLTAVGYGVPLLTEEETQELNAGEPRKKGSLGLIAPGTGLGMSLLVWCGEGYMPLASEGGHVDFSPNDPEDVSLWAYLREKFGHVSPERIVSGMGLINIYEWLKSTGGYEEPDWLRKKMGEGDPARIISETAIAGKAPICEKALDRFMMVFGAVAGDLALIGMTRGGMYLGGGIPAKILPKFEEQTFMRSFTAKGRFEELMTRIPVYIILNHQIGLMGAAERGFMDLAGED